MAFDYGSINLGITNPFKLEGRITAIRGAIQLILGLFLLVTAASNVKRDPITGWTYMFFGIVLLATGIKALSSGIYATLRYFVGRNHPTSLANNYSPSEGSSAQQEAPYVAYTDDNLEEMLVGRKNITFLEPQGMLARLLHSFFPKLLFLPFPIRNMAQRIAAAWVKTLVTLVTYGLVAFVTLAGFAGKMGDIIFSIYSVMVVISLLKTWRNAARPISRNAQMQVESFAGGSLASIISRAIILPVLIGIGLSWMMDQSNYSVSHLSRWLNRLPDFNPGLYLLGLISLAIVATVIVFFLLNKRLQKTNPVTQVSELRENWQESVHPNEIFINLDNLVMANRRYKEVPNRVYRALDPVLRQQINGKGDFQGQMLQGYNLVFKRCNWVKVFLFFELLL
ncbi:MAG: hypothetical protein Q9M92_13060 [Enterobacterales bacterium]|nr:hypothetical protein [Enterobacterales bacterium]